MARIVLGIATSHTPMLNTPAKDWPSFIDRDAVRNFLDKDGNPATYEELLCRPDPRALPELSAGALCRAPRRGESGGRASETACAPRRARRANHRR